MLSDLALPALLEELAAPRPAPGAGSALAVAVGAAAAVVEMAARLSDSWADGPGSAAQAEALRLRAIELAQLDADAYQHALDVRTTAATLSADRRDWAIGKAFAEAAEPPLALARLAADVADLARFVARNGDERVRPDVAAALALAAAAARGARELVAVNLTALPGDVRLAEADRLAAAAAEESQRS